MYGNVQDAQTHWTDMGYEGAPTQQLLAQASTFIDGLGWKMTASGVPVSMFPGIPTDPSQTDEWPRTGAVDAYGRDLPEGEVPAQVVRATYEAAYHESLNPGSLNEALRADQVVKREKFGEVSFDYAVEAKHGALSLTAPVIPAVMRHLALVLSPGSERYGISGVVA